MAAAPASLKSSRSSSLTSSGSALPLHHTPAASAARARLASTLSSSASVAPAPLAPDAHADFLSLLLMSPTPVSTIERLFAAGADGAGAPGPETVAHVQKVLSTLTVQQASRSEELRNLIGLRYLSFLHSADSIRAMVSAATDLDSHAARVCRVLETLRAGEAEKEDSSDKHTRGSRRDASRGTLLCGGASDDDLRRSFSGSRLHEGRNGEAEFSPGARLPQPPWDGVGDQDAFFLLSATPLDSWLDGDASSPGLALAPAPVSSVRVAAETSSELRGRHAPSAASAASRGAALAGVWRSQQDMPGSRGSREDLPDPRRDLALRVLLRDMQVQLSVTSRFWRYVRDASVLNALKLLCLDTPTQQRTLAATIDAIQQERRPPPPQAIDPSDSVSSIASRGEAAEGGLGDADAEASSRETETLSSLAEDCRVILAQAHNEAGLLLKLLCTYTLQSLSTPLLSSPVALQAGATLLLLPWSVSQRVFSSFESTGSHAASEDGDARRIGALSAATSAVPPASSSHLAALIDVFFSCRSEALQRLRARPAEPEKQEDEQRRQLCCACSAENGEEPRGNASAAEARLSRAKDDKLPRQGNAARSQKHGANRVDWPPGTAASRCLACTLHNAIFAFESSVGAAGILFLPSPSSMSFASQGSNSPLKGPPVSAAAPAAPAPNSSDSSVSSSPSRSTFLVIDVAHAALFPDRADGACNAPSASRGESALLAAPSSGPEAAQLRTQLEEAERELSVLRAVDWHDTEEPLASAGSRPPAAAALPLPSLLLSKFSRFWLTWRKDVLASVASAVEEEKRRGTLQTCHDVHSVWSAVMRRLEASRASFLASCSLDDRRHAPCGAARESAACGETKQAGERQRDMWRAAWTRVVRALLHPSVCSEALPRESCDSRGDASGEGEAEAGSGLLTHEAKAICRRLSEALLAQQVERQLCFCPSPQEPSRAPRDSSRRKKAPLETEAPAASAVLGSVGAWVSPLLPGAGVSEAARSALAERFDAFNRAFAAILEDLTFMQLDGDAACAIAQKGDSGLEDASLDAGRCVLLRALVARLQTELEAVVWPALLASSHEQSFLSSPPSFAGFLDESPLASEAATAWAARGRGLEILLRTAGPKEEDCGDSRDSAGEGFFAPAPVVSPRAKGLRRARPENAFAAFLRRSWVAGEERSAQAAPAQASVSQGPSAGDRREQREAIACVLCEGMTAGYLAAFTVAAVEIVKPVCAVFKQSLLRAVLNDDTGLSWGESATWSSRALGAGRRLRVEEGSAQFLAQERLRRRYPGPGGLARAQRPAEREELQKGAAGAVPLFTLPKEATAATTQAVMHVAAEASRCLDSLGINPLYFPPSSSSASAFVDVLKIVAGDAFAEVIASVLSEIEQEASQASAAVEGARPLAAYGLLRLLFDTCLLLCVFKPSSPPPHVVRVRELRARRKDAARRGARAREADSQTEGGEAEFSVAFLKVGSQKRGKEGEAEEPKTLALRETETVWSSLFKANPTETHECLERTAEGIRNALRTLRIGRTREEAAPLEADARRETHEKAEAEREIEAIRRASASFVVAAGLLFDPLLPPSSSCFSAAAGVAFFEPSPLQLLPPRERFQLLPVPSVAPGTASPGRQESEKSLSRALSLDEQSVCAAADPERAPRQSAAGAEDGVSFKMVSKNLQTWLSRPAAVMGGDGKTSPLSLLPAAARNGRAPAPAGEKARLAAGLNGAEPAGGGAGGMNVDTLTKHMGDMGSFFGRQMEHVQNRVSEVVRKGMARMEEGNAEDRMR
ncbi:hypothetical protein BESB_019900 [Besnoitia besnoiti]|uniref:Uncharacterized protein n=1 Tax=Besnoitia besnoiti TaxID=94643 RepID=A0A2A9M259_BESBE|nr:hypothetical protein BESB_019900 [Besnoitia besnoiti]PFH32049.1 hypothetical protein BESB_019900 [Besnoitia besnoiti]